MEEELFGIKHAAQVINVHQRTLRIYDDEQILIPSRSEKNRRLYTNSDLKRGILITTMTTNFGLNLAAIKMIFNILTDLKVPKNEWYNYLFAVAVKEKCYKDLVETNRGRKPKEKENTCT
jgi:MerR family transcriptional regulator/heat shock protein HspR